MQSSSSSSSSSSSASASAPVPPAEFEKIIHDFVSDLVITFPELMPAIRKWWTLETGVSEKRRQMELQIVFRHCVRVYPEQFFDILYKNDRIFSDETLHETNDEYLPAIHFRTLWKEQLSDATRTAIWNYLQLVLMSVAGAISSQSHFGNSAKLFEAIDEEELKTKLTETMSEIQQLFTENEEKQKKKDKERRRRERFRNMKMQEMQAGADGTNAPDRDRDRETDLEWEKKVEAMLDGETSDCDLDDDEEAGSGMGGMFKGMLPDMETLHQHLQTIMQGKLGRLATELADETARELELDLEDVPDPEPDAGSAAANPEEEQKKAKKMFQKLMANPDKLKKLVSSMGEKIGKKIEDGELTHSEIMEEAASITEKMKDMPGMDVMSKMMASMGMKMGKSGMGQMTSHLKRETKMSKLKERIRQRAEQKVAQERLNEMLRSVPEQPERPAVAPAPALSDEKLAEMFRSKPSASKKKKSGSNKK
jgi:hypothetical protein